MTIEENATPSGLRVRADMVRDKLNDSGSCARHLELAADKIESLETQLKAAENCWRCGQPKQTCICDTL